MRPRGSGGKAPPVTPMSERQQMALLMQMTSPANQSNTGGRSPSGSSRSRDRNERGETPLHLAAIKGDVEQVSKLLAHRADPNATDFAGWTPLHEACNHGWFEVAYRLVQAGASVNAQGLDNDTPLHDAASNGHQKLVRLLVDRGADINAKNKKGKTPLDVAAPRVVPYLYSNSKESSQRLQNRANRDEKKASTAASDAAKKCSSPSDVSNNSNNAPQDIQKVTEDAYEFKSVKGLDSPPGGDSKGATDPLDTSVSEAVDPLSIPPGQNQLEDVASSVSANSSQKRAFSEITDPLEDTSTHTAADEDTKRKKRKDSDAGKDVKPGNQTGRGASGPGKTANQKPGSATSSSKSLSVASKSPCPSPKPSQASSANTETNESDDSKSDLKVPPLKIVIPQGGGGTSEQDSGTRNGKSGTQRSHQALPYVVAASSDNSSMAEKDTGVSGTSSPTDSTSGKQEEKKDGLNNVSLTEEQQRSGGHHQRVLRSSHRSNASDRASNNSSPQLQPASPPSAGSPPACTAAPTNPQTSDAQQVSVQTPAVKSEKTDVVASNTDEPATVPTTGSTTTTASPAVELHPRKRKLRPNKEQPPQQTPNTSTTSASSSNVEDPHDQPVTNCYQLFINIRKQIERRRKNLFPVQPKPPQGFKDYLMNRCSYMLARNAPKQPKVVPPISVPQQMQDVYVEQEKERFKLRMQHLVEKEKLVLSVEQEILRVHGLAARTLANQIMPFSACTVLREEEVYNLSYDEEERSRNARSRYNGRLFLSWLQDVDDKWEKIKETMLLRHHNEAESLHAVQRMDWEWKMKEMSLCEYKATPHIDDTIVPMVHVSDDFDLLPA